MDHKPKYYTTAFRDLKVLDTFSFPEWEALNLLNQNLTLEDGTWETNNNINKFKFEKIDLGHKWQYSKASFFKKGPWGTINAKTDITSKTILKESYSTDRMMFCTIPKEIINTYQTACLHNKDLSVIREYVKTVESTVGWNGDWQSIKEQYNQTNSGVDWHNDFSIEWYTSIKQDGLISLPSYIENRDGNKFLARGTHRSYLSALAGYDFNFFTRYTPGDSTVKYITCNSKSGNKYFSGEEEW